MKTFYALLLALGICLGFTFPAMAEYPAKPIMLMTAFNAGGGSDLSHRLIEKFAKGVIPQPIVVTYKCPVPPARRQRPRCLSAQTRPLHNAHCSSGRPA